MKTHGGKRKGAGRPKVKNARVTLAVRVLPETKRFLEDSICKELPSVGRVIDWLAENALGQTFS